MSRQLSILITIASTLYAIFAVLAFLVYFAPFAVSQGLSPGNLLVSIPCVVAPNAVLLTACLLANQQNPQRLLLATALASALVGAILYAGSFRHNDGEYVYAFFITPLVQAPLAIASLLFSLRQRPHNRAAA